jgi:hypothetical protein
VGGGVTKLLGVLSSFQAVPLQQEH